MNKMHVKRGDTVKVIAGKDKGKEGKVITAIPSKNKVIVEGVAVVKRHTKARMQGQESGILTKEAAIDASNVAYLDPVQKKPTRLRYEFEKDANGEFVLNEKGKKIKYRVAVLSGTRIDK